MRIFVYRESTSMAVAFGHKEDAAIKIDAAAYLVPVRWAMISYQTGFTTIAQRKGDPDFMVIAECGPQFSRDEIMDIFEEIGKADVDPDEKVVVVHRAPPNLQSVNQNQLSQ